MSTSSSCASSSYSESQSISLGVRGVTLLTATVASLLLRELGPAAATCLRLATSEPALDATSSWASKKSSEDE